MIVNSARIPKLNRDAGPLLPIPFCIIWSPDNKCHGSARRIRTYPQRESGQNWHSSRRLQTKRATRISGYALVQDSANVLFDSHNIVSFGAADCQQNNSLKISFRQASKCPKNEAVPKQSFSGAKTVSNPVCVLFITYLFVNILSVFISIENSRQKAPISHRISMVFC